MADRQILQHPATGDRIEVGGSFSLGALILGPIWFAIKGMFVLAVLAAILSTVTLGVGWLALPFLFNGAYRKHLIKRGYQPVIEAPARPASGDPANRAKEQEKAVRGMAADVARIPVNPAACMECGGTAALDAREFGFARILEVQQEYGAAGAAAAASIVSGLLGGPMMLRGPKTTTTANIVRAKLVLCQECLRKRKNLVGLPRIKDADYALHPWWGAAQQHGFTTHLDSYQLAKYH